MCFTLLKRAPAVFQLQQSNGTTEFTLAPTGLLSDDLALAGTLTCISAVLLSTTRLVFRDTYQLTWHVLLSYCFCLLCLLLTLLSLSSTDLTQPTALDSQHPSTFSGHFACLWQIPSVLAVIMFFWVAMLPLDGYMQSYTVAARRAEEL